MIGRSSPEKNRRYTIEIAAIIINGATTVIASLVQLFIPFVSAHEMVITAAVTTMTTAM